MERPALVVFCDLDGTLVLDNSFHAFLRAALAEAGPGGRLALAARLLPRLLGGLGGGHGGLKRRALGWFARQPPDWQERVVARTLARLRRTLSAPILREIRALRAEGARVVLATAAPDLYARRLAGEVGAEGCLATPGAPGPGWRELLGRDKAEACRAWLERHLPAGRPRRIVVMTDHLDDLPLLAMADRAVLQASPRGLEAIAERMAASGRGPAEVTRIDVLAPQEGGGCWLWFDDRPEGPVDPWEVRTILSKHRHARLYAGDGRWRRIGPGQPLEPLARRRDCPRPPGTRERLAIRLRRRAIRDWLGIFH